VDKIIRDAAIYTMAVAHRDASTGYMEAYEFLGRYAGDSEEDWEYYTELLSELGVITEKYRAIELWSAKWSLDAQSELLWVWSV
jgi:hypothetical protein